MGTLITISQFILALAILVTLHELGHYLAARAFGIKVEKFYLFFDAFGIKLFKFKKGDTEYGIGWLPLGGYVKIAGMIDESLDSKQMASQPEPWEFRSKPAWQRLIVMIGGVTVNLILGLTIIITMLWMKGDTFIPNQAINVNGGIYASPEARNIGFANGDKIMKLNGKEVNDLMGEFANPDFIMAGEKKVEIRRGDKDTVILLPTNLEEILAKKSEQPFIAPPYKFKIKTIVGGSAADKAGLKSGDLIAEINGLQCSNFFLFKEILQKFKDSMVNATIVTPQNGVKQVKIAVSGDGTIGFQPELFGFENSATIVKYGLGESIVKGTEKSFGLLSANAKAMGKVVTGKVDAKKSLAGPVGIAQMYGSVWDWANFWTLTAMLSLVLAFMNILPIPALDGGHVMFLLYEMITGKPVNEKVLYVGQIIGMVLLFSLIAFIFWVDIARLLGF